MHVVGVDGQELDGDLLPAPRRLADDAEAAAP
jgi:hypothetical protein